MVKQVQGKARSSSADKLAPEKLAERKRQPSSARQFSPSEPPERNRAARRRGQGKKNDPSWTPAYFHLKRQTKIEAEFLVKMKNLGDLSDLLQHLLSAWVVANR